MKFISNISEKTGLQENMILGILLIFSSVVLYFIYKKMNNKKENFANIVQVLIPDRGNRKNVKKSLKNWCKGHDVECTNSFNMGNGYDDGSTNCSPCFAKCYDEYGPSGTQDPDMQNWCKIGCNLNNNITDTCSQVIADLG